MMIEWPVSFPLIEKSGWALRARHGSNEMAKPEPTLSADPGFLRQVLGSKLMKDLALNSLLFLLLQEILDEILVDRKTEHLQFDVIF